MRQEVQRPANVAFFIAKTEFEQAKRELLSATQETFGMHRKAYVNAGVACIQAAIAISNIEMAKSVGDELIREGVNLDRVTAYQQAKEALENAVATRPRAESSADLAFEILRKVGILAQKSEADKRFFAEVAPSVAKRL